jgi:hypothetical protein
MAHDMWKNNTVKRQKKIPLGERERERGRQGVN